MDLPPSLLVELGGGTPSDRWPEVVASNADVRASVERALENASDELAGRLLEKLVTGTANTWHGVRAALWTDALARRAGATFVEVGTGPLLHYKTELGEDIHFAPLSFRTLEHLAGPPAAVARVVAALETVLLPHRFAVYIREPIGEDVDSSGLVAATYGWVRQAERGVAARYASFDDAESGLHLDIDLLPEGTGPAVGAMFVMPPCRGPEWLGLIDRRLQQLLTTHPGTEPLIPVLCADPKWNLGRGFPCQWLYGTPSMVDVQAIGSARIRWANDGIGFFADPVNQRIPAVWWVERGKENPMSWRGWSHGNPSAPSLDIEFPGARLAVHHEDGTWSWNSDPPTSWEAP